jgi:hypothetical protein
MSCQYHRGDSQTREPSHSGVTRRGFLTGVGAGAAGAVVIPGQAIAQQFSPSPSPTRSDRFSRLFSRLRPFADASRADVQQALRDLGAPGGLMDAKDPLDAGPIDLIRLPGLSPNNRDNAAHTAGITFLGQFLDHDMTFDLTSRLGVPTRPERSPNSRTPKFDLDTVYGGGPFASPQLYNPSDRAKLRVESGGQFEDVPRGPNGTATLGDPRNDENMMISGLQAAFLLFHNRVVDLVREDEGLAFDRGRDRGGDADQNRDRGTFDDARRLVTWHYQWIIVNEFLPAIVGRDLVLQTLSGIRERGPRFYTSRLGDENSIPVEFQIAYRFGHSLVRPSYRANLAGDLNGAPFFGFIFDPLGEGQGDPVDLRGGARAPRRFIGWQTFFNFGGNQAAEVRPNKTIDTKLSTPLFNLPLGTIASGDPPTSLAQRNLLRHLTWSLASGQDIARELRIRPLTSSQLSELAKFGVGLENSTPLWYYILKEAELAGGSRLVGVGARLVCEVFLALLALDEDSYLSARRPWRPTLPRRSPGNFTMVDLLTFAGVDPASRKQ